MLYVDDIDTVCSDNVLIKRFADDCKLYSEISERHPPVFVQQSLDRLCSWADSWQLTINVHECQVLSTCRSKSSRGSGIYFINGISLANERSVPDLGLHVSSH